MAETPGSLATPSNFDSTHLSRNPFEAIDAKSIAQKNSVVAINAPAATPLTPPDLTKFFGLSSVSLGSPSIAIINGSAFAEREIFIARSAKKEYRILVKRIHETGVDLECAGVTWNIAIVRPEFNADSKSVEIIAKPK
jgi:hypothetical protein